MSIYNRKRVRDYYEIDCWIFCENRAACGNHLAICNSSAVYWKLLKLHCVAILIHSQLIVAYFLIGVISSLRQPLQLFNAMLAAITRRYWRSVSFHNSLSSPFLALASSTAVTILSLRLITSLFRIAWGIISAIIIIIISGDRVDRRFNLHA